MCTLIANVALLAYVWLPLTLNAPPLPLTTPADVALPSPQSIVAV